MPVELCNAKYLVFKTTGDQYYVASKGKAEGLTTSVIYEDPRFYFLRDKQFETIWIPEDHDIDNWDKFWWVANCDCAFPPVYVISASDESDAIEEFLEKTDACLVEEPDDYDDLSYDCNGRPMDTEQLRVARLYLVSVYFESP